MATNIKRLEEDFLENDIGYHKLDEDGLDIIILSVKLDSGYDGIIYLVFDEEDEHLDIMLINYIKISDESRIDNLYKKINSLNILYSDVKFTLRGDSIFLTNTIDLLDIEMSDIILHNVFHLIEVADLEYHNIMNLLWEE